MIVRMPVSSATLLDRAVAGVGASSFLGDHLLRAGAARSFVALSGGIGRLRQSLVLRVALALDPLYRFAPDGWSQGIGFRVGGLGFTQGSGFKVKGLGSRVQDLGLFKVGGMGFRVQGLGLRV